MAEVAMVVSNRHDPDPRVQKEAVALVEAGHSVVIYAFDRQHELQQADELLDGVSIERIRLSHKVPYGGLISTARGIRAFRREVKRRLNAKPVDIVHCHDQDTCAIGLWWKRSGRGKFVFDAHDLYWTWLLLPDPHSLFRRTGAKLLERRDSKYARAADMLIVGTGGAGGYAGFHELYSEPGVEPVVVMNCEQEQEDIAVHPEKFTIGFMGGVRDTGMFQNIVNAILSIDDESLRPRLRVAGAGTAFEEVSLLLEGKSAEGLDYQISGRFSSSELPALMAECSVQYCVYSMARGNIANTIPAKLFTSLAHNRKVIVNADCLTGYLTEKNQWGWAIEGNDIQALSALLSQLSAEWGRERSREIPWGPFTAPPSWNEQAIILTGAYADLLGE